MIEIVSYGRASQADSLRPAVRSRAGSHPWRVRGNNLEDPISEVLESCGLATTRPIPGGLAHMGIEDASALVLIDRGPEVRWCRGQVGAAHPPGYHTSGGGHELPLSASAAGSIEGRVRISALSRCYTSHVGGLKNVITRTVHRLLDCDSRGHPGCRWSNTNGGRRGVLGGRWHILGGRGSWCGRGRRGLFGSEGPDDRYVAPWWARGRRDDSGLVSGGLIASGPLGTHHEWET